LRAVGVGKVADALFNGQGLRDSVLFVIAFAAHATKVQSFGPANDLTASTGARTVTVADFNDDGALDLAVAG
jgi:hypothetical protein